MEYLEALRRLKQDLYNARDVFGKDHSSEHFNRLRGLGGLLAVRVQHLIQWLSKVHELRQLDKRITGQISRCKLLRVGGDRSRGRQKHFFAYWLGDPAVLGLQLSIDLEHRLHLLFKSLRHDAGEMIHRYGVQCSGVDTWQLRLPESQVVDCLLGGG